MFGRFWAMRSRALRRHNAMRIKNKVKRYWTCWDPSDTRWVGILARSKAKCSCWMCGNPRKTFKEITFQEKKFLEKCRVGEFISE